MIYKDLGRGYELKEISLQELNEAQKSHHQNIFSGRAQSRYIENLSLEVQEKIKSRSMQRWRLCLGLFHNHSLVGWHCGYASEADVYCMQNSVVFENHRNQGLYSQILAFVLECAKENGFQVVVSFHHPNNAAVIIPKLKQGFIISSMLVHEKFRSLIEMKYFIDPKRKQCFDEQLGLVFDSASLC